MLVFDPFVLLLWIFLSSFLPGALLSISLLKKTSLNLVEKIFVGFGIGFILPQLLPIFLLFFGIQYSFGIAIAGSLFVYLLAIISFIICKPFELKIPEIKLSKEMLKTHAVSIVLLLVIFLAFWIRLQSYGPIFQELDPYYYDYVPQQIITLGHNPFDDKTAWYPEITTNHRTAPGLAYMEAMWYSFYTAGSSQYDNLLLSTIAGIYPAIAGALAIFFLYLMFSSQYKREYALIGATIASFVTIFLLKTLAGESEIQPYAFFALPFFFAAYAFAIREKEFKSAIPFILLSVIAAFAVFTGTSSTSIVFSALIIFTPLYAMLLFFKNEVERLKSFALTSITVVLGIALAFLFLNIFVSEQPNLFVILPATLFSSTILVSLGVSLFAYALYAIHGKIADKETRVFALICILIIGLVLFAFTPLKTYVSGFALSTLKIAEFNNPLQRTIAEQGTTGSMFQGMLGFMAAGPEEILGSRNPLNGAITLLFEPFSAFTNLFFQASISILNSVFGAGIVYDPKANSLLLVIIALEIFAVAASVVRFIKKGEVNHGLLFAAIMFPPAIVGILKAKYVIYIGFFFAGAVAMLLGELDIGLSWLVNKLSKEKTQKEILAYIPIVILIIGIIFTYLQFVHDGWVPTLLAGSLKTRFQDNPMALKEKMELVCSQIKLSGGSDEDICSAAENPVGYASKGTNYQYSQKLCSISIIENPFNPTDAERVAAGFRCSVITDYWIESMEWIRYNTENDSRTTSWWDYGHWINFFGQKDTVLRNEHASSHMIGEVAHVYIDGSTEELIDLMKAYDSKYVLFDSELVLSGNSMGGKYGALDYLSCARDGETGVKNSPGTSGCETQHLWETIYVQKTGAYSKTCMISQTSGKTGIVAYSQSYSSSGTQPNMNAIYCVGEVLLANGQKITGTYYLDKSYPNGDLKLNKALLNQEYDNENTAAFTLFYTYDKVWIENGEIKDGYGDRKGKFYDSNIYKGFFLENLPGFELVFKSKGGEVKIYKMVE